MKYQKSFDIFNHPKFFVARKPLDKIIKPGIYLFGGMCADGSISRGLRILKTGQQDLAWESVETQGCEPEPRFLHTATLAP